MKYYLEIIDNEHYLNPYEIACLYGVLSKQNKGHSRFVARLLTEYCVQNNIQEKYYYETKNGMMRVYPSSIYKQVMDNLIINNAKNTELTMVFDNKNHYFILDKTIEEVNNRRQFYTGQ